MYAVIRYFNYRKEVSFNILKIFNSLNKANLYALYIAEKHFGKDNITNDISDRWVYIDNEINDYIYTTGSGYDQFVYSIIEIDNIESDTE